MPQEPVTSAEELRTDLKRLDKHLDDALRLFADYEAALNHELKTASSPEQRSEIFERRNAYEMTLGIDTLVERIDAVREQLRGLGPG